MRFAATITIAAGLLIGSAGPAQVPKESRAPFEPRSAPGAGQEFLRAFEGDFRVAKTFYPRQGEPVRVEGRCHQALIHDGRFLKSDFVFGRGARATTGVGIIGFEPETGLFTSFWADSRQTRMSVRRSRDPFDGKQIILYSQSFEDESPDRRSMTVSRPEDGGHKLIHRQYALGPGGEERLVKELVMIRETPSGSAGK